MICISKQDFPNKYLEVVAAIAAAVWCNK